MPSHLCDVNTGNNSGLLVSDLKMRFHGDFTRFQPVYLSEQITDGSSGEKY